jgi:ABC-type uncharacterized transport system involved in gliding motility auxiliary subunit
MNRILVLAIVSLAMIAVGGGYYLIEGALTLGSAVMLWGGLMLLLFLLYAKFDDVKKLTMKKSAKYGANMVAMVGVFFLVIIFAAVLGHAHKRRLDLTRSGRFTLSAQTKKILQGLNAPVKAVAFYRSESGTMHAKQKQTARDLLEEFAAQSKNFTFTFIDPDQNPGMAQKYGVTEYRIILFMSGARQVKIGNEREETFTNSLIKLIQEKQKVVYFVKGHGEKEVSSTAKTGYSAAGKALAGQNFELREIVLAQSKGVPPDASVVVLASPDKDLMAEETQKLDAYFKGGGALLVMIDPGHPPALATWLEGYGFKLADDVIIDQQSQLYGANNLTPVVYAYHKKHPLTQDFRLLTFFPIAESVFIDEDPKKGSYQLALTGPNSWASLDKKGLETGNVKYDETREKRGPIPVMSVTTWAVKGVEDPQGGKTDKYGKIVVVGDSDFPDNTNFNLAGNGDLFLNTVSWLAEEANLVAVRAKKKDVTPVVLTASQGRAIFWIPVVMVPGSILLMGLGIYSKRRWFRQ